MIRQWVLQHCRDLEQVLPKYSRCFFIALYRTVVIKLPATGLIGESHEMK